MEMQLPGQANYFSFCGTRIREIKAIESQLDECEHGLRAFQKLPRNMQRRAVSSNPHRLPLYLREKHKREVGSKIKQNKRPCRKYRRRPSHLLEEYSRRQRNQIWLETHIWHAKRFHMIKSWGYYLPKTPTNKSFRASLRAATELCLIQDISYECCFEIEGSHTQIHTSLATMLSADDALQLMDSESRRGFTWVQTTLYKQNRCPFEAIGDAQILWVSNSRKEPIYKLWVWVHPSIFEEVLSTLIKVFGFEKTLNEDKEIRLLNTSDCVTIAKISSRNVPLRKTPKYSSSSSSVELTVLKDTLVKFRLTGPRSYALLRKVLQPSDITVSNSEGNLKNSTKSLNETGMTSWWVTFYSNPSYVKANNTQLSLWKSLQSSNPISRRVLSLVVRDPRIILPSKKQPFQNEEEEDVSKTETFTPEEDSSAVHPIVIGTVRDSVTLDMKPTSTINDMRANSVVPGSLLPLKDEESRVPVLLLERPGSRVSGLGSGWDIVMPCAWASQTLVAFVMNGAVVGGQSQEETLKGEFLLPPKPHELPDTTAGKLHAEHERQEREDEYFKRPPNCRQNLIKFGIRFPFGVNWKELMNDWNTSCENYYVLRDKKYLQLLASKSCKKIEKLAIKHGNKMGKRKLSEGEDQPVEKVIKMEDSSRTLRRVSVIKEKDPLEMIRELKDALIYIRLVLIGKGTLEPFAMICVPTEEDLESFTVDSCCSLAEPVHEDKNLAKRTEMKMEHKKNLNSLRRKRKKAKNEVLCGEENPLKNNLTMHEALKAVVDNVNEDNKKMVEVIQSYSSRMNKLWLRNSEEEKLQLCIRKIMGYLTHGGFCVRMGRSGGLGYVVAEALLTHMHQLKLLQHEDDVSGETSTPRDSRQKQILVLVRNPSTLQYRWARLVILNV